MQTKTVVYILIVLVIIFAIFMGYLYITLKPVRNLDIVDTQMQVKPVADKVLTQEEKESQIVNALQTMKESRDNTISQQEREEQIVNALQKMRDSSSDNEQVK